MPTYPFTLSTWSDNSGSGGARTWGNPGNAQVLDGVYTGTTGSFGTSHYLLGTGPSVLGSSLAGNELLSSLTINVQRMCPVGGISDSQLCLVVGGAVQTSINKANTGVFWPEVVTLQSYNFSSSDLASLGITKANLTSNFGVALAVAFSGNDTANVDQISGSFTTYYIYDIPHPIRSMPGAGITHL